MFSRLSRYLTPTILSGLCLCLAACDSDDSSTDTLNTVGLFDANSWVAIEPRQCMTNPWEVDWLMHSGHHYEDYPKDPSTIGLEPGEVAIIKDYYRRQGVVVSDTATTQRYEVVCMACSCPEGHTMFLRVRDGDVETMIGFGYRHEPPPWWSTD